MSPVWAPFVSTELLSRSLQTAPAQSRCRYSGQPQEDGRKRPQESWGTRLHVYVPYPMYFQQLLVPVTRPQSASPCHRRPLDSSRSPAHDKEQASTSLFISLVSQYSSHG